MSKREYLVPDYFRMRENMRIMQTRETVVDIINGRGVGYNLLDAFPYGVTHYPTEFVEYVESSDDYDDDEDDDDYDGGFGSHNSRYCGFTPKFLDRGIPKSLPAIPCFKTATRVSPEEAAKNAKELVDEEEKIKKKAEKKKQKKMRQRERRRLEKLEKENADKDKSKKVDLASEKSKPAVKEVKGKKNKTNNNAPVPPDPGPHVATESSNSSDENNDKESEADEPEELDMNSCFVTNAAAIAKRKLEQKLDRKEKKEENSRKHGAKKTTTAGPQLKNKSEEQEDSRVTHDFVTKSLMLATKGNEYAAAGNLDMAVKYFTDAIKHNPKEFKLFGNRSFCYEKMQQYEKALVDADLALSLSPTWIKGLYRKGKALVGLKRYYDASLIYKEVLKLDSSCTDAAQELMRVQIMQLMDMGFTREQSSNALIIHGTVAKALEALSGLQGSFAAASMPNEVSSEEGWVFAERKSHPPKVPLRQVSQNQPRVNTAVRSTPQELFPIWVGDLVPEISESKIYELFKAIGPVHSVRVLQARRCAFVNYTNKEHCEKAIRDMHGYAIAGTSLVVRYPDRLHTHLGASKAASTDTGKVNKLPDECYFWRTTGCIKSNRCAYRHVPEHKGIDRANATF
ncbi:uncharacterized protein [Salminus brasiliensis]|uniref:uncharacterized protein isoform X2 n=1 Tax=Salminus brasiliensis TaxID=930266 RepID=UPI003B8358B1